MRYLAINLDKPNTSMKFRLNDIHTNNHMDEARAHLRSIVGFGDSWLIERDYNAERIHGM